MTNLRIIADDLGLHPSVNDGIIFLLKNKYISGASIMANGQAFDDAVSKKKKKKRGPPPPRGGVVWVWWMCG